MSLRVAFIIAMLTCIGGLTYMSQKPAPETKMPIVKAPQEIKFKKEVKAALDNFLKEVTDKTRSYKKQRKILRDLIKPVHLRNETYVRENYQMLQTLLPALRAQMDEVMMVFEHTDTNIKSLLEHQSKQISAPVLAQWQNLKMQEANLYVEFFAIEEELLQNHESLLKLYYTKQNTFHIDLEKDKAVFDAAQDQLQETSILNNIDDLLTKQAMLLKSG